MPHIRQKMQGQAFAKAANVTGDWCVHRKPPYPFCCQDDYSCLLLAGHCQPQLLFQSKHRHDMNNLSGTLPTTNNRDGTK